MRSELSSNIRSSTRAISSDELFSPIGQLAAQTRITPAASSLRTPPSRPRASARNRGSACRYGAGGGGGGFGSLGGGGFGGLGASIGNPSPVMAAPAAA